MNKREEIIKKYKSGVTQSQISRDLGISKGSVHYHIQQDKINTFENYKNAPSPSDHQEMINPESMYHTEKGVKYSADMLDTVYIRDYFRYPVDVSSWRKAMYYKEQFFSSYWLYNLYREIWLDPHIQGVMNLRKSKLLGIPFIIEQDGVKSDKYYNVFDDRWFRKFMDLSMNYIAQGFTLIEFTEFKNNTIHDIREVPLKHLVTEKHLFNPTPQATGGMFTTPFPSFNALKGSGYIDYFESEYADYIVEVFKDRHDAGLFFDIAPIYLWKRTAEQVFSQAVESYSQPIRVAKSGKADLNERKRLFDLIKQMGQSLSILLDSTDDIEIIQQTTGGDPSIIYTAFIELANSEMSKAILGGTLIVDQGGKSSSRALGQVHSGNLDSLARLDAQFMRSIINDQLIPKLETLGILPSGITFKFDMTEQISLVEKFKIDVALMQFKNVDDEYLMKTYNTVITPNSEEDRKYTAQDILAISALNGAIGEGKIDREAAVSMLTVMYGLSKKNAESMITEEQEELEPPIVSSPGEPNQEEVEKQNNKNEENNTQGEQSSNAKE